MGGIYAGAAATGSWDGVFQQMRNRVVAADATPEEEMIFRNAILNGIDTAFDNELSDREREALRHLVLTAFDGIARMYSAGLAPKAQFLNHVEFPN